MFEKLKGFYAVFTAGQMVANPLAWKKGQMTGGLVAGFLGALIALAKGFGYDLNLTDSQLLQIGGAIVAVFGLFNGAATVVSTNRFGLSPIGPPANNAGSEPVPQPGAVYVPSQPGLPSVPDQPATPVPYQRHALNGDPLPEREPGAGA